MTLKTTHKETIEVAFTNKSIHMKVFTCHFPIEIIAFIDHLVLKGWIKNRSEAIRQAVTHYVLQWGFDV